MTLLEKEPRLAALMFAVGVRLGELRASPAGDDTRHRLGKAASVVLSEAGVPGIGFYRALIDLAIELRPVSRLLADEAAALARLNGEEQ